MTSDPDKLFRDKLGNYQRPAPPTAWVRIERNVSKTRILNTRMKIAAAILLMITAGYLMWPKSVSVETAHTITEQKEIIQPGERIKDEKETVKPAEDKPIISSEPNPTDSFTPVALTKTKSIRKNVNVETQEKNPEEKIERMTVAGFETEKVSEEASSGNDKDLSLKIVYSGEEVNARLLKEKIAPELLVRKENKTPPKSPGLVYAIKHSDIGIGDLRQIKDELLTFEFLAQNDKNNKSTNR